MRSTLERERLVLLAEAVPSSIGASDGRKLPTLAAIGLSQQRMAVYVSAEPVIDVTWDSGDARDIEIGAPDDGLRLVFDAERFGGKPGRVELLLKVGDQAAPIMVAIEQRRRELPPRRPLAERDE
jgi:hypothetical protein